MNSSIDVESSKQIFPILANGYICFSEDFSMLRFEDFLFEKTDSVKAFPFCGRRLLYI